MPTSGPMPVLRNIQGRASPPEPAISLMIITLGPKMASIGVVMSLPSRMCPVAQQRAPQVIDDVVGDVAAAVVALIDDGGFLADLRKVVAVEIRITAGVGVGQVDVGHAAAGQFVHLAAIVFDPGVVAQARFRYPRGRR